MTRRLLCRLGLHAWIFAYAPHGRGYRAELSCVGSDVPARLWARTRSLRCVLGLHRMQRLTAPPSWRKGEPLERREFCIFCEHRGAAWRFVHRVPRHPGWREGYGCPRPVGRIVITNVEPE